MIVLVAFFLPILGAAWLLYSARKKNTSRNYAVHEKGIILVTGASTGIGRHAVEYLARKQKFIVLAGVRKESDFKAIEESNITNLKPILLSPTSHESCFQAVKNIESMMQAHSVPFIGLVNNAGVSRVVPLEFHDLKDIQDVFDINVIAPIRLTQLFLPLLKQSKGRIINISSTSGFIASPTMSVYCASKWALEAISDGLRREVDHNDISVTVIQPAYIKTPILNHILHKSAETAVRKNDECYQNYELFFNDKACSRRQQLIESDSSDPIVVSKAIENALVSSKPQTRYIVGKVLGWHAWCWSYVCWASSDRQMDFTLLYDTKITN